jgi:glutaredoxin
MLELYQFEGCPHSQKVRQQLSDWGIDYILRNVPQDLGKRTQLMKVSGQATVPTLVDSDREQIFAGDEEKILSHLNAFYKPPEPVTEPPPVPGDATPVEEPSFPEDATGTQKKANFKGYT